MLHLFLVCFTIRGVVEIEVLVLLIKVNWQTSILLNYSVSCPSTRRLDASLITTTSYHFVVSILDLFSYYVQVALHSITIQSSLL